MSKYGDASDDRHVPISPIGDPCYPKGYERSWSVASCEASPHGDKITCKDAGSKLVKGTGNAGKCYDLVDKFLKEGGPDAPGQYFVPPLRGHFIAIENFWYVRNDLKLPMDLSTDARQKAVQKACESTTVTENKDIKKPKECFALSYHSALIDTLKARKENGADVEVIHELNGADVDWALGVAIVQSIKNDNTVVVSDGDLNDSYDSFAPAYAVATFEIAGLVMTIAVLYMCVCRSLIFGRGKGLNGRAASGIGMSVLGSSNKLV